MPGPSDTFIASVVACQAPGVSFPAQSAPGLPNFLLATASAHIAGCAAILPFIPPNPLTSGGYVAPPISTFVDAFMSAINIPSAYGSFSLGIVSVPGRPGVVTYDTSPELWLMYAMVMTGYQLCQDIVTGLRGNVLVLPTYPQVLGYLETYAGAAGLDTTKLASFLSCVATATVTLYASEL